MIKYCEIKRIVIFCCLLISTTLSFSQKKSESVQKINIDANWLYLEKDTKQLPTEKKDAYQKIDLPHTWNAIDAITKTEYRKASSWYRKYLDFSETDLLKRIYIRFGAAGQEAKVYLNGKEITHHKGGYSAFACELTSYLKTGENKIDVWVDNQKNRELAPLKADYNFYGGLYRSVELITAPKLSFAKNHFASSGVRIWSENVSAKKSDLNVTAFIDNGFRKNEEVTVLVKVTNPAGKVVSKGKKKIIIASGKVIPVQIPMSNISKPILWSPETPNLYKVSIELLQNKKVVDGLEVNYGFRWFEFTANDGFFLNGKPYKLNGINRHQDYYQEGNAVAPNRHLTDVKLIKGLGVNWLRLAHYQQDDYVLNLCDSLGILVWEEIPYVNNSYETPEFEGSLQSMMKDLITQHFNHPSIILWGMGNEVWLGDRGDGKAKNFDMLSRLNDFIHKEDPVRKTVFVNGDNNRPIDLQVINIPDVFGYNLYRGWYGRGYETLTERLNEIHTEAPERPIILSEFGAGSDVRIHSEKPQMQDFSIEYQNNFILTHLEQTAKLKWLNGLNYWSLADFGAAHRGDSKPHINQKGLVTFDRKKKDAYYIVKANWSKDPVVYIESPYWKERSGNANKTYRVFSNMNEVTLFHNGKSLGSQKKGFVWKLNLIEGENTLLAKGSSGAIKKEHGFKIKYQKNKPAYKIKASSSLSEYPAKYAVDGDYGTRWSTDGDSTLELDLHKISLVNGVVVHAYITEKIKNYKIEIKGSSDGVSWKSLWKGNTERSKHNIFFTKQEELRYLKIETKGNKIDKTNSFSEIEPILTLEKQELNLYEKIGAGKD